MRWRNNRLTEILVVTHGSLKATAQAWAFLDNVGEYKMRIRELSE